MADNELKAGQGRAEFDELDKVLASRPKVRAPRNMAANVIALIATLPETAADAAVTPRYVAPVVKVDFANEAVLEPAVSFASADLNDVAQRGQLIGRVIAGLLAGFVTLLLWTIWPAVSLLFFGPPTDLEMQTRLAFLQKLWENIVSGFISFFVQYGALLPSALSLVLGLGIMTTLIVNNSYRRQNFGF